MKRKTAARQRRGKKIMLTMLLLPAAILVGWLLLATAASESATDAARNLVESSVHRRGNIYDRHFEPLAVSFRLGSIYARPLEIDHPEATAAELAAILPVSQKELLNSLRAERSFIWLARRADEETMERVAARNLAGIHIMPRSHRFYPQQQLAAHAVGFVRENQGLAGLELAHDELLQNGRAGRHLLSTLDLSIQRALQERLERARRTVDGRLAGGLVMDVESGAVAAMVNLPAYDPNNFWAHDSQQRVNQLVVPRLRLAVLEKLLPELATARPELARQLGLCQPPERGLPAAQQAMALDLAAPHGGLSKPAEVDCHRLLADPEARFSGLALLTAFSRLAGGGAAVEPHLDGRSWDGVKARRLPVTQPGSKGEAIDLDNWRQLLATADAGQGEAAPVVVESLVRQRQAVDEVQAVVARVGEGGPGEKPTPAAAGEETPPRYQNVMLALDRQQDPTLALLLFIDRARLAPDMPSPLAGVARQLSGWSREWQQDEAAPPARQLARQQQELYRQWLESRDDNVLAGGGAVARFPRRLPDVVGQSLRRALRDLQAAGLTVQVEGSGRVVGQTPAAGTPLTGIEAATVKLRAAYTTADLGQ